MREGWESCKFADIFDLQMGKTPSRDNALYWNDENTWLSIADLNDKKYISESKEGISEIAVKESGIKVVPTNTVIMSFKLSIGKTAITTSEVFTNEAIMAFIEKEKGILKSEFIYYYLRGYKWMGANKAVLGMTLNKKTISEQIFAYPPLSEQERIVEELDCLSGVIEKKKQQLKELDALAQSIFYEMFGNPVENDRGWEVKKLGEVCNLKAGKAIKSTELYKEFALGLYPCFGGNGVRGYIAKVSHNNFFPIIGRQGALCGNVVLSTKEFYATEHAVVVQPIIDMNIIWLYYTLKFMNFNRLAQGVAQPGLSVSNIIKENIFLPSIILQQQFAEKIEVIEKQKELIRKSIEEVEMLFNSRMDYYFG